MLHHQSHRVPAECPPSTHRVYPAECPPSACRVLAEFLPSARRVHTVKELETGGFLSALGSTRQRHSAALGGIGGVGPIGSSRWSQNSKFPGALKTRALRTKKKKKKNNNKNKEREKKKEKHNQYKLKKAMSITIGLILRHLMNELT